MDRQIRRTLYHEGPEKHVSRRKWLNMRNAVGRLCSEDGGAAIRVGNVCVLDWDSFKGLMGAKEG